MKDLELDTWELKGILSLVAETVRCKQEVSNCVSHQVLGVYEIRITEAKYWVEQNQE